MEVHIITHNERPFEAYADKSTAWKRYEELRDEDELESGYGVVSLPILDAD